MVNNRIYEWREIIQSIRVVMIIFLITCLVWNEGEQTHEHYDISTS